MLFEKPVGSKKKNKNPTKKTPKTPNLKPQTKPAALKKLQAGISLHMSS